MVDAIALHVNHGFMFSFCEGDALTCWDKDTVLAFVSPENYKVLWKALAYLLGRNARHVRRNVIRTLQRRPLVNGLRWYRCGDGVQGMRGRTIALISLG